jgi:hypothetical protein
MNTPALLGKNHTNKQEYFYGCLFGKPMNLCFIAESPNCVKAIGNREQHHFFNPWLAAQKRTVATKGNCSSLDFLIMFRKFTCSSVQHRILHLLR